MCARHSACGYPHCRTNDDCRCARFTDIGCGKALGGPDRAHCAAHLALFCTSCYSRSQRRAAEKQSRNVPVWCLSRSAKRFCEANPLRRECCHDGCHEIPNASEVDRYPRVCAVTCFGTRIVATLVTVLAGLLVTGLLSSVAHAHDSGASTLEFVAHASETAVVVDEGDHPDWPADAIPDPAECDDHCCHGSVCCPLAAELPPLPFGLRIVRAETRPHSVDLALAAPDGPRRPPRGSI